MSKGISNVLWNVLYFKVTVSVLLTFYMFVIPGMLS